MVEKNNIFFSSKQMQYLLSVIYVYSIKKCRQIWVLNLYDKTRNQV